MIETAESLNLSYTLAQIIHKLVGWDKETAIWWAGACELTFHFDCVLFWVGSPFPPAPSSSTEQNILTGRHNSGSSTTSSEGAPSTTRRRPASTMPWDRAFIFMARRVK